LELEFEVRGKNEKMLIITDGIVGYTLHGGQTEVDKNPKGVDQIDKEQPGLAARVGMSVMMYATSHAKLTPKQAMFDLDKEAPIKNLKLGAKAKVGKRNAQVIDYQVELLGKSFKASVWIDTQTLLPLKRVLTTEEGDKAIRINETYAAFTVDAKQDPKLFEIPK
jgi:hypothetical protein